MDRKTALKLAEDAIAEARSMEKYGLHKIAMARHRKAEMLREEAEYTAHEDSAND